VQPDPQPSSTSTDGAPLLDVSAARLVEDLGSAPFPVRHHVDPHHPLLTREALIARAADWPSRLARHRSGHVPFVMPTMSADRLAADAAEVMRDIDHNSCWLVLWELERSPRYSEFLDECLDPVDVLVGTREGGITDRGLNVLASSPEAVVPAHFDMHHNFLLQVDGTKEVTIGSFSDPRVNEHAIDRFYDECNNNAPALPDVASTFPLGPGDGVYIPPFAFHWVAGGPDTSISISCGFRTRATEQANLVHECNARLRRLGLHPRPPGTSVHRDRAKVELLAWARRARRASEPVVTRVRNGIHRTATPRS
jgi:hypothetical protein